MGTPRSDGHRRCQGRDSRQLSKRDASHAPNLRVHEVVTAQRPRLTAIAPHLASAWTPGVERCQLADPPTPACCRRGRYYHGVSVSFDKVRSALSSEPLRGHALACGESSPATMISTSSTTGCAMR